MTSPKSLRRAAYTLHVVGHVRWPREFDQPFETTRLRWVARLDHLLDLLTSSVAFRALLLDGQSILIEDYLALRPERYEQIETLVQDGKLWLGPWYVQPDPALVSAESLIRNLSLGLRTARTFGLACEVVYLPGGGGAIAQLPQLLRGFRLDSIVLVRGAGESPAEFVWEAPDGSQALVAYMREGIDPLNDDSLQDVRERLAPYAASGHLLIPNRVADPARADALPGILAAAKTALPDTAFQSTLPGYVDAIRPLMRQLPVVRGELRSPARFPLDTGTLTTRLWIKQRSHVLETLLTRWVEPFTAWAESLDGHTTERIRHPQAAIERAWRLLLQNQSPEVIGGTISDAVCADVRSRFDQAEQIGAELIRQALDTVADHVDTSTAVDGAALIIFNPGSTARADMVDVRIELPAAFSDGVQMSAADGTPVACTVTKPAGTTESGNTPYRISFIARDVPPSGYTTYRLSPGTNAPFTRPFYEPLTLENDYLHVLLDSADLTITLTDKAHGMHYTGLLDIQAEGDVGDARLFCQAGGAIQVIRRLSDAGMSILRNAECERLGYQMQLILEPTAEMEPETAENVTLIVDVELRLWRDLPRLDVWLQIHNTLANHRVRVRCPLPFVTETALYDVPFLIGMRPVRDLPPISPPEGWPETPLNAAPQQAFVAAFAAGDSSAARPGLLIANCGLPEVDVLPPDGDVRFTSEIAITALRSVSYRTRPDLTTRADDPRHPIHAERATGLEMRGDHTAELSLIPTDSQTFGTACAEAWAFSEGPFNAVLTGQHTGPLPPQDSLIRASIPAFRISAVKLPDEPARSGIIVRGYNTTHVSQEVTLTPWRRFAFVDVLHLDESETGGRLALDPDGSVSFRAAPNRILTVWFHDEA
ncbi:MAG: glycoside hydrolase family 38 N-terminal domain-containing protein [Aggregatilineales bacterium]